MNGLIKFTIMIKRSIGTDCIEFGVSPTMPLNPEYKPGQFFSFNVQKINSLQGHYRSYSVVSKSNGIYYFIAKLITSGIGSRKLRSIQCGDSIDAYGPFGEFSFNDLSTATRKIFVSTSTGIGPFISMIPQISNWIKGSLQ